MKKAFIVTIGGDDRGGNVEFGGVTTCKETAERAAKNRGAFGSANIIEQGLLITDKDDNCYLLNNKWGTLGSGNTLKPRKFNILVTCATDEQIDAYFKIAKLNNKAAKLIDNMSNDDILLLQAYLNGKDLNNLSNSSDNLDKPAFMTQQEHAK